MKLRNVVALLVVCAVTLLAQEKTPPQLPAPGESLAMPDRVGVSGVEKRLSLEDAIAMAIQNNTDVAIERTNIDTARQFLRAAQGVFDTNFRWQPGLAANNTPTSSILQGANGKLAEHAMTQNFYVRQMIPRTGAQVSVGFENSRNTSTNLFSSLNPFYTSKLNVELVVPLVRNREVDANRAQILVRRKQLDSSQVQFQERVINIVTQVEFAYWDLVGALQDTQVQLDAVSLAQEQLAQDQRQIKAGTLAPVELSAAEAELERRRDSLIASVTTVTQAENNLKILLLGSREDPLWNSRLIPVEEKINEPIEPKTVSEALSIALKLRPELHDLALQSAANDVMVRLSRNQTRPQINLVGDYSNQGLAGTLRPGENPFTASSAILYQRLNDVSTQLGLPPIPSIDFGSLPTSVIGGYGTAFNSVFAGRFQSVQAGLQFDFSPRNRVAKAQLSEDLLAGKRLELQQNRQRQLIEADVRNALQSLESARQRIVATQASEAAAYDKLQSETRLFKTGESTNFLVLTRQNEYLDSRQRRVLAQNDYNKAVARFEQSLGKTLDIHQIKLQ